MQEIECVCVCVCVYIYIYLFFFQSTQHMLVNVTFRWGGVDLIQKWKSVKWSNVCMWI